MEGNGWGSAQMLRRYGASARSARARRRERSPVGGSARSRGVPPGCAPVLPSTAATPGVMTALSAAGRANGVLVANDQGIPALCAVLQVPGSAGTAGIWLRASPHNPHKSGPAAMVPTKNPRTKRHYPAFGGTAGMRSACGRALTSSAV